MILVEFERTADLEALKLKPLERFARVEGDGALAITSAEDVSTAAGKHRPVRQLFGGGKYGEAAGPFLFHVALWTPQDFRDEFLAWYECEHLPMLLEADGWDGCRFVEERIDDGCLFHALHQLRDRGALDSDARKRSRATPWFARLANNPWFDSGFKRALYRRI
ncbi:MAG: hypothetical protein ACRENA_06440 [Vulcanimicrobiaceae bacterium]